MNFANKTNAKFSTDIVSQIINKINYIKGVSLQIEVEAMSFLFKREQYKKIRGLIEQISAEPIEK